MLARVRSWNAFTVTVTVCIALAVVPIGIFVVLSGIQHADTHHGPPVLGPVLGMAFAAVPMLPLLAAYVWLSSYLPDTARTPVLALLWGITAAPALAVLLEWSAQHVNAWPPRAQEGIVAPLVEEACKGAFVVLMLVMRKDELFTLLDGLVYAGLAAVGFAFTENILYLAAAYNGTATHGPQSPTIDGAVGLTATFIMRCLVSPFAHPLFTSMTGIGVGVAAATRSRFVRVAAPLAGYLTAVLGHMSWNGSLLLGEGVFVGVYAVVMLPAAAGVVVMMVLGRRTERRMLADSLGDAAVRGLVPATDIGWVVDLTARRKAREYARERGGATEERAMRDYQAAATQLGYAHARFLRGTPAATLAPGVQDLLARIRELRSRISFPGQVVFSR
jgi:protease PrsW